MAQETSDREANDPTNESGPILIASIAPSNFLSFGPGAFPIELRSLNVLIGANGSGKSNLIEAIAFLRAAPTGFQKVTGAGGGVSKWIYKGHPETDASIYAIINDAQRETELQHIINFRPKDYAFQLGYESIADLSEGTKTNPNVFFIVNDNGRIEITVNSITEDIDSENLDPNASVLALFRDPTRYPQLTYLADQYSNIRIYRNWQFGRDNILRYAQKADAVDDHLEEDYSNLGVFLNRLLENPETKATLGEHLSDLYDELDDITIDIKDEAVRIDFEEHDYSVSAVRVSDGTLRYLALLAILCDPTPPPLICLEEPEIGLHTDLIPGVARLLVEASQRTQLIVTTHSDIFVDALTETLEAVLVCEKHAGQTEINRLNRTELSIWLDKYRLGELWLRGEIGGKRW